MNHIKELLYNEAPKERQIVASGENHWERIKSVNQSPVGTTQKSAKSNSCAVPPELWKVGDWSTSG
ncbi:MAG: hypothetical protein MJE63_33565 [Proteobacteria bacterium]|nr:hypothetical protein [Pseudomonadota bacterium]